MLIHRVPSVLLGLIAIWLTTTLGCGSSTRVVTLSDEPAIRDEGGMISLDNSLEPLIERFNADRDKPRVVAIVSATCGACVRGAIAVNESVVNAYPRADVSIFIVWIDILATDDYAAAQRMAGIFNDPRVRQFHDPNRLLGDAFAKGLLDEPPAWDRYLRYAARPPQLWVAYSPTPAGRPPARGLCSLPITVGESLEKRVQVLLFGHGIRQNLSHRRDSTGVRALN